MEQKFSEKMDHLIAVGEEQLDKVKKSKHKHWIAIVMFLMPCIPDELWILGALVLTIYFIVSRSSEDK